MGHYMISASRQEELTQIMSLFDHSRQLMRSSGNMQQWVAGYPSPTLIAQDIENGHSFAIRNNGAIVGVFAFIIGRDPTYTHIEDGSWQDDDIPYGTIHRLACAPGQHGIAAACINWCRRQITSLRADTHADNAIMQYLLTKHGFEYRGIIHITDGTPRLAYQITDTKQLCEPLVQYLATEILPRYSHYDAAHRQDHIKTVIDNSMALSLHYEVNINMVYTIAAYHDLGLCGGREQHHLISKQLLLGDVHLQQWFSRQQIAIMANAVEDHRASSTITPRTIYGKIVAEADRDIDPDKIILRTVQYGLMHYPQLSHDEHWIRVQQHLEEKYGHKGYLKLYLPESPNAQRLTQLRALIADRDALREAFEKHFSRLNDD